MDEQSDKLIQEGRKILIIPRQQLDLDVVAATFSLALGLKSLQKEVSLYMEPDIYTETVRSKFPPHSTKFLQKDEPGTYVITLDNIDAAVQEVKWKEKEGKVNIFVKTEKGNLSKEKIKINQTVTDYDATILVGLNSGEPLGEFYKLHLHHFRGEKLIAIAKDKPSDSYKGSFTQVRVASYSEAMFRIINRLGITMSEHIATNLLAGLYWTTNSFKHELSKDSFGLSSQLIQIGASQEQARNIALQTISFAGSTYFADVYGNLKAAGDGIFYSVVPESSLTPNGKEESLFNDFVPIVEIIGCKMAFVIVHGKENNKVFIRTNSRKIDIKPLIAKYNGTSTLSSGSFVTKTPLAGLEELVVNELRNIVLGKVPGAKHPLAQKTNDGGDTNEQSQDNSEPRQIQQVKKPKTPPTAPPEPTNPPPVDTHVQKDPPVPTATPKTASTPQIPPTNQAAPTVDPLAAAQKVPKPLDLEKKEEGQPMTPAAPNSPLPPASV
ncbi:MAG: hypothetical protein ACE5DX_05100 [Candidatus Dojkabacteria bacterium]